MEDEFESPMPSVWNARTQSPALSRLEIDGTRVRYVGLGQDDKDAAAVLADHPIPSDCPLYYFEVEIVSKGRSGFIGIGLSGQHVDLGRLPGWEKHSYAYHGDDGNIFREKGTGIKYGPMYTTGDVIGVVFDRLERTIAFTKNGYNLGVAFENIMDDVLYPTVGFRTPGEEARANFAGEAGGEPFRADVQALREEAAITLFGRIRSAPENDALDETVRPSTASGTAAATARPTVKAAELLRQLTLPAPGAKADDGAAEADDAGASDALLEPSRLVYDYLVHHGHWETAKLVAKDALGGTEAPTDKDIADRVTQMQLSEAAAKGDVDAAMRLAETLSPGVLASAPRLNFRLQVQRMIRLLQQGDDLEALAFGQTDLLGLCHGPEDEEVLSQAMTLFAYDDPESSPSGWLMKLEHRQKLGRELVKLTLDSLGRRDNSLLESLLQQINAGYDLLRECRDPAATCFDPQSYLDWAVQQD